MRKRASLYQLRSFADVYAIEQLRQPSVIPQVLLFSFWMCRNRTGFKLGNRVGYCPRASSEETCNHQAARSRCELHGGGALTLSGNLRILYAEWLGGSPLMNSG